MIAVTVPMLSLFAIICQSVQAQEVDDLHAAPTRRKTPPKRLYLVSIELRPKADGCTISIELRNKPALHPKDSTFRLGVGSYTLNVACDAYKKFSNNLVIPHDIPQRGAPLVVSLERMTSQVTMLTDPPEAEVYIGGLPPKRSGPDGLLIMQLEYGHYDVRVQKNGYLPKPKILTLDLSTETHIERVKLDRDDSGRVDVLLDKALAENRIEDAFVLFEKLSAKPDSNLMRQKLVALVEKLNQRSATMLEHVGPEGLSPDAADVAEMRRWYVLCRSFLAYQPIESNGLYEILRSLWEVEWRVHELATSPAQSEMPEQKETILAELAKLEVSQLSKPTLVYEIGCLYRRIGELGGALRLFRRARAEDPSWAYPYFASASILMTQAYQKPKDVKKNLLAAAEEFEQAVARDANLLKAYVMLVICYADARQGQKAVDAALRAQPISPEGGQVKFALGYAYFSLGRSHYGRARFFFEASLMAGKDQLNPEQRYTVASKLNEIREKGK